MLQIMLMLRVDREQGAVRELWGIENVASFPAMERNCFVVSLESEDEFSWSTERNHYDVAAHVVRMWMDVAGVIVMSVHLN
jgi:hypothetical protein